HMLMLLTGSLLAVLAIGFFFASEIVVGALVATGAISLILTGANGLGRSIQPNATMTTPQPAAYPAALTGRLDPALTRWAWLVKWILAVPHYVVLWLLGIALVVVTLSAGLAVLATGRYPASLFQFAVGVIRWHWRVAFYATAVL